MKKWLPAVCLGVPVMLLAQERTPAPLPAAKAATAMLLPDGFSATVFAAEPDVVQPISFCIDTRGRLFVAEALNYGAWQPTGKDRIIILEDMDDVVPPVAARGGGPQPAQAAHAARAVAGAAGGGVGREPGDVESD